ncbi:MAG: hypothetical protein AVO34_10875 [Firmicutes bacterium ML8_F2]|jgi:hypothetical protein|nr:MAG: hypothetical protein AVO34_10875 [Firmicutes bacterium ML8_F2]
MDKRKFVLFGLLVILLGTVICGCGEEAATPEEDTVGQAEEGNETTAVPDNETAEDETGENEETAEETPTVKTDSGEQSETDACPGTVFKHDVKMNIDGVVEKDLDEGWWEEP